MDACQRAHTARQPAELLLESHESTQFDIIHIQQPQGIQVCRGGSMTGRLCSTVPQQNPLCLSHTGTSGLLLGIAK